MQCFDFFFFFAITFFQLLNPAQLWPDEKEKVTLQAAPLMGEAAWPCPPLFVVDVITAHAACRWLSRCLGQISGGAGRSLLGLICPVRFPVPGRRASGHENGGGVVRGRNSRHALDFQTPRG